MVYGYQAPLHQCQVVEAEKPLSSGLKMIEKCSLAKDFKDPEVTIDFLVMQKALAMTQVMDKKEWLGYLKGFKTEDGFHIEDIVIPRQVVTSCDVDEIERVADNDIIGTVHSHNTMGTFFSSTDHDYIGANNPVMVVVDSKGNSKCAVRATLQCGNFILLDAELTVIYTDSPEIVEFITANKDKITEKVYVFNNYQNLLGLQGLQGYQDYPYYPGRFPNQNPQCNQHTNIINARVRRWDKELQCWITEDDNQPRFNGHDGASLSAAASTTQSNPKPISNIPDPNEYWPW
jgi:hypothetical protein